MENIANAKIHILFYENADFPDSAFSCFSALRKQKFLNCTNPKVKFQNAAAEFAVCAAMKNAGFPFAPPEYAYNGLEKPFMKNGFLSISHTDHAAACIVFSKPVGLDIEHERRLNPLIAGRILNRREFSAFIESKNRNDFLIRTWVAKESFLKLTGIGLRKGMRNIDFHPEADSIFKEDGKKYAVSREKIILPSERYPDLTGAEGNYYICLCTEEPVETELTVYNSFSDIIDYLKG